MPTIVKSRPILETNQNSVILKLEKYRHFQFVKDSIPFEKKENKLLFRGAVYQKHRVRFFDRYFDNAKCDIGHVGRVDSHFNAEFAMDMLEKDNNYLKDRNLHSSIANLAADTNLHALWSKGKLSIENHLPYKFLLSLEGYDVASNLKWVLSSNSLCMMPKPEMETWFMESTLKAGVHYVEIDLAYSNVEEQMEYYLSHESEAKEIVHNANEYCKQFFDNDIEGAISLLVLRKYFYLSGQIDITREEKELFGIG